MHMCIFLFIVYISKEIIQRHDAEKMRYHVLNEDKKYIEKFLTDALVYPTDKFSNLPRSRYHSLTGLPWILSGRYFEDYISTGKFARDLDIVGYSINPEHLENFDVDWLNILSFGTSREGTHLNRKIKFVVLIRNNVVKMALSGIRGKMSKQKCHSSNTRFTPNEVVVDDYSPVTKFGAYRNCSLSQKIVWRKEDFIKDVKRVQNRNKVLFDMHRRLSPHSSILYYEDLQLNPYQSLMNVLTGDTYLPSKRVEDEIIEAAKLFVDEGNSDHNAVVGHDVREHTTGSVTKYQNKWKKRTGEDLREHIENFDELTEWLNLKNKNCLLECLTSTEVGAKISGPCTESGINL